MTRFFSRAGVFAALFAALALAYADPVDDFIVAIRNDNVGRLKSLLDQGFDPNTRNAKGQPGLIVAMQEQSPKAARMLMAQPSIDIDALNAAGESALMIAALKGETAEVKALLARGAKVQQPGWAPLHYAAIGPETAVVTLLIDQGAPVDALSPNGSTPLMLAAQYGSEENVKALLARGANPALRNQKDLTALDFARLGGRDFMVRRFEALPR